MTATLDDWDLRLRSLFGLSLLQHPARLRDGLRAACKELAVDDDTLLARVDRGDHATKVALARALTIGETYFFREPPHFDLLRSELLPAALARGTSPVVLVSAACSSGEEAYSMAVVARQVLGVGAAEQVRVLGIDVNERAITSARHAEYRPWSLRGVSDDVRARWLERSGEAWRVIPAVRSLVTFERRNLVDPADALPPGSADVIFCRNVLIYLDDEHVRIVLQSLSRALRPGGALLVSSAEAALLAAAGLGAHPRGDIWVHSPGDALSAGAAQRAESSSLPGGSTARAGAGLDAGRSSLASTRAPRTSTPARRRARATPAPLPPAPASPERTAADDVTTVLDRGWASLASDPASASMAARRAILLDRTLAAAHVLAASAAVAQLDPGGARRSLRNARRYLSDVEPTQVMRGGGGATAAELSSYCARLERTLEGRMR